jgi:hypothetical protein
MFGRWQNVRLRAAEVALREGRLEDALGPLAEEDLRESPRGRKLADAVVEPLLARARLHRQAGRYSAALADLQQIQTLGRDHPDLATLRARVEAELNDGAERAADAREAARRAADHLRQGRLDTARHDVAQIPNEERRAELAAQLAQREQRGNELLTQAREALERDDVLAALRYWDEAGQRYGRTQESEQFARGLGDACRTATRRWLAGGQIDHLLAVAGPLGILVQRDPSLGDCERMIELTERAAAALARRDYSELRQTLLRLRGTAGEAHWIENVLNALTRMTGAQEELLASPLGAYASQRSEESKVSPTADAREAAATPRKTPPDGALTLREGVVLLVDGGGSSLLLDGERVRIGRASSSSEVDVALPADVEPHHADIVRRGEDFFLHAYGPVVVNRQSVQQVRLNDGDRVTLGNAKLTFHRPSAKSASAVLRLSHRCRLPMDVSSVVLFIDTCVVGQGAACHVTVREPVGRVVVFEQDGYLHTRPLSGRGHLGAEPAPLKAGQPVEFGDLRVTATPLQGRSGGRV